MKKQSRKKSGSSIFEISVMGFVCKIYEAGSGSILSRPEVLTDKDSFQFEMFADKYGSPQFEEGPFVRVSIRLSSKVLAPLILNGASFSDRIVFTRTYTFPLLNPDIKKQNAAS